VPVAAVARSDYLLSFGLSLDWEFERQFDVLAKLKALHCYDHTVARAAIARMGVLAALKGAVGSAPRKRLRDIRLALSYFRFFDGRRIRHFPLAIEARDSASGRSFETALGTLSQGAGGVFLKCDIEGGEYLIAEQVARHCDALTGMAIEFHDIASDPDRLYRALDALMVGFVIVHIHANNSVPLVKGTADVLEVSFLNRSLAGCSPRELPRTSQGLFRLSMDGRELDAPNSAAAAEIELCYA
jgi:hypothetical protein